MKAVILAAGEGTRLNKGWTIVPKPLLEVGDKTIIEHVILNLKEAGFNEFVVVIGFMSEHIKDHLRNGIEHGVNIKYVFNKNYKDDMITSLLSVKDHIQGPFLLCMADLFFNGKVITKFLENNKEQINQDNFVLVDSK
jgi:NDP-sugar pyrophosphorylase family protein